MKSDSSEPEQIAPAAITWPNESYVNQHHALRSDGETSRNISLMLGILLKVAPIIGAYVGPTRIDDIAIPNVLVER